VNRLDMEIFMKHAGISMVHVPYKGGAGQAVTGIVSGEVVSMFVTLSSAIGYVNGNRLRALGVVAPQRVAALPNVPTMAEQGFPQTSGSWQGVLVPAGTPRPVVDRLFREVHKVMALPDAKERFDRGGVSVVVSKSPEEFGAFMRRESERWGTVVKEQNIIAD
jgi:tripartite-type tricarboxylate transporter receptor subunit TctC